MSNPVNPPDLDESLAALLEDLPLAGGMCRELCERLVSLDPGEREDLFAAAEGYLAGDWHAALDGGLLMFNVHLHAIWLRGYEAGRRVPPSDHP